MCMLPEFLIQNECAALGTSMCAVKRLATLKLHHYANKERNKGLRAEQLL